MILGDLLVTAIAIAIEPLPLLTFILTLASKKGVRAGWAYLLGWTLSLVVVVGVAVGVTGGKGLRPKSNPGAATFAVDIVLGFALIALGLFYRHRHRDRDRPATAPKLLARVESMGVVWAALLGIFMQPWMLVAAGAVAILRADMSQGLSIAAVVLFCVLGSSVLLTLQLFAVFAPERASHRLARLRTWLETHRGAVITGIALVLGAYLLVRGVYGLL